MCGERWGTGKGSQDPALWLLCERTQLDWRETGSGLLGHQPVAAVPREAGELPNRDAHGGPPALGLASERSDPMTEHRLWF